MVIKSIPNQMGGRYWPVFLMKIPATIETKERERTKGKR